MVKKYFQSFISSSVIFNLYQLCIEDVHVRFKILKLKYN